MGEFIGGLGSAAAWPMVARAQIVIPGVSFLGAGYPAEVGEADTNAAKKLYKDCLGGNGDM